MNGPTHASSFSRSNCSFRFWPVVPRRRELRHLSLLREKKKKTQAGLAMRDAGFHFMFLKGYFFSFKHFNLAILLSTPLLSSVLARAIAFLHGLDFFSMVFPFSRFFPSATFLARLSEGFWTTARTGEGSRGHP